MGNFCRKKGKAYPAIHGVNRVIDDQMHPAAMHSRILYSKTFTLSIEKWLEIGKKFEPRLDEIDKLPPGIYVS